LNLSSEKPVSQAFVFGSNSIHDLRRYDEGEGEAEAEGESSPARARKVALALNTVPVRFGINAQTNFGETVVVCGRGVQSIVHFIKPPFPSCFIPHEYYH
jgi:hypothetical protein